MTARFHADHVGSLLRPPALLEARRAHAAGRLDAAALRAAEDRAILDALALQRAVGLEIYSDGEYRRDAWMSDLADAVEGFVPERVPMQWRGPGGAGEGSRALVAGARLRQTRRLTAHEVPFLQEHSPGPFKITMPSPSVFIQASYRPGITDRVYPTRRALLDDLVPIVRGEIAALLDAGVSYVQLDAPQYSYYGDPTLAAAMRRDGVDPDKMVDEAVAGDVACLDGLARAGVTLACHVCRGNNRSRWVAEGGYDFIAERLFGTLPVDTFLLEYDSERAGGFAPLRLVPKGRTVVLGLVTTKEPRLESPDELRRRIDEASRYVPLENLALSPQCGFASVAEGNLLSWDDQRRKLELVVETARRLGVALRAGCCGQRLPGPIRSKERAGAASDAGGKPSDGDATPSRVGDRRATPRRPGLRAGGERAARASGRRRGGGQPARGSRQGGREPARRVGRRDDGRRAERHARAGILALRLPGHVDGLPAGEAGHRAGHLPPARHRPRDGADGRRRDGRRPACRRGGLLQLLSGQHPPRGAGRAVP